MSERGTCTPLIDRGLELSELTKMVYWFRFDDGTPTDSVAKIAVGYLHEADQWWAKSEPWWKKTTG